MSQNIFKYVRDVIRFSGPDDLDETLPLESFGTQYLGSTHEVHGVTEESLIDSYGVGFQWQSDIEAYEDYINSRLVDYIRREMSSDPWTPNTAAEDKKKERLAKLLRTLMRSRGDDYIVPSDEVRKAYSDYLRKKRAEQSRRSPTKRKQDRYNRALSSALSVKNERVRRL